MFNSLLDNKCVRQFIMKPKILLIDDIKEFSSLLRIILSERYSVVTAKDGMEALDLLEQGYRPDVIITDLAMPRMDGITLILIIKNNQSLRDIPIIVLSNYDKLTNRIMLKEKGVCSYIIKPYCTFELRDILDNSLKTAMCKCG